MNPLFITLKPKPESPKIGYDSKTLMLGSCFAENISEKLGYYKFQVSVNPFGIIFHPEAIYNILNRVVNQRPFTENDIFYHNEQWCCYEVHSSLNQRNKSVFLNHLNQMLDETYSNLASATHLILTYGTAWGYLENKQHKLVANCHKISQKEFSKQLINVTALKKKIEQVFILVNSINSEVSIINTISPVRHIKDGIIENSQSKSHLISALHASIATAKNCYYFPAYELVIDCLRDYRFYEADLLHPNAVAIDYIWEHFQKTWIFDKDTQSSMKLIDDIQKGKAHKPFNHISEAHQQFLHQLEVKKKQLYKKHPNISFE